MRNSPIDSKIARQRNERLISGPVLAAKIRQDVRQGRAASFADAVVTVSFSCSGLKELLKSVGWAGKLPAVRS